MLTFPARGFQKVISHFFVVPEKVFMKTFKAFLKRVEAPRRNVKIKV